MRQQVHQPRQGGGRRLVSSEHERDDISSNLVVRQLIAVLSARIDQHAQHVGGATALRVRAPTGDGGSTMSSILRLTSLSVPQERRVPSRRAA